MEKKEYEKAVQLAKDLQKVCLHGNPPIDTVMKIASALVEADQLLKNKKELAGVCREVLAGDLPEYTVQELASDTLLLLDEEAPKK